jgi:hypothetical protein
MQELALIVALAGMYVSAQAADLDPSFLLLYYSISWIVPVAGVGASAAAVVALAADTGLPPGGRLALCAIAGLAGVATVLSVFRPFSNALVRFLFRGAVPSHTLRLTARIVMTVLLLALPGWFAVQGVLADLLDDPRALFDRISLGGELVGYVVLALAAVGYRLRRDLRQSLERLGIGPLRREHLAVVPLGVIALFGLNVGAEWVQRVALPELWESDQRVNQQLAAGLGFGRTLLLGLSAGIGEEITMRGALQPMLGLFLTSLLFAVLHVQYSWFGIAIIMMLGIVLGTIRLRAGTTTAMAVHTLYDVIAIFSI